MAANFYIGSTKIILKQIILQYFRIYFVLIKLSNLRNFKVETKNFMIMILIILEILNLQIVKYENVHFKKCIFSEECCINLRKLFYLHNL